MEKKTFSIQGPLLIEPDVFNDSRGFFLEFYSASKFRELGIEDAFVQDNHSLSRENGVLRGLHLQLPPYAQAKLVKVIHGAIWDVFVDLRKNYPTFGRWDAFKLAASSFSMIYIPKGFAHGFCTLERNTEMVYKCDQLYTPSHEVSLAWDDPDLNISWPIEKPILSNKDSREAISWCQFQSPF